MHPPTKQEDRSATIGVVRMYGSGYVRVLTPTTPDTQKSHTNIPKTGDKNKTTRA
ncbi:MAG: hypothetical protein U9Q12_03835 [Patescibacteria group bacterium]|nr:hypothetical protein [Patescibacteria group bacterium]